MNLALARVTYENVAKYDTLLLRFICHRLVANAQSTIPPGAVGKLSSNVAVVPGDRKQPYAQEIRRRIAAQDGSLGSHFDRLVADFVWRQSLMTRSWVSPSSGPSSRWQSS